PLALGQYDVYCDSSITFSDQPCIQRILPFNASGREELEMGSASIAVIVGDWTSSEAAHLSPLEAENP
ncbi:hypothetical protein BDZ91DRAFT_811432, partial [Kalaharituber pfeilii]